MLLKKSKICLPKQGNAFKEKQNYMQVLSLIALPDPSLLFWLRYVLFAVKRRQEIKVTNPELTFSDVTKMLGYEWTNLQQETKEVRGFPRPDLGLNIGPFPIPK